MYLECSGSGSPTVILESGYRNDADIWSAELEPGMSPVFSQVARFTRVCAYDRPGTFLDADHLGRSTPVPMPRTARDLVSDLHALLQTAHVPGPYVFAAHSFGGIFARLYASTYPNEVVGMVLVDALSEKVRTGLTPEQWKLYVNFGFTKPTPGLEKYKDIETLDVNASLDQMEKAASAEPLSSHASLCSDARPTVRSQPVAAIASRFSRSTEQSVAHGAGCAGDTCTKRQTQNRDQKLALHSSPGTATGDRRNQAGRRGSPQSGHMDDRTLIRRSCTSKRKAPLRERCSVRCPQRIRARHAHADKMH